MANAMMIDLEQPIDSVPLTFVDVETTGLDPSRGDRVCEVALLRVRGGVVEVEWERLIDPERPMGYGAYRVRGISEAMLRGAPRFADVAAEFVSLVQGTVFVGHNARFDLGFIASELKLAQQPLPSLVALDTLALARRNVTSSRYSLGALCEMYGIAQDHAHRAMGDVHATRALFERLSHLLRARGIQRVGDFLGAQGGVLRQEERPVKAPPLITEALARKQRLRIRYQDAYGSVTERLVLPLQVSMRFGQLYLVAHCFMRNSSRTFAVDRIQEMALVDEPATDGI
jgi:DNA polymerase III subunit epsilon